MFVDDDDDDDDTRNGGNRNAIEAWDVADGVVVLELSFCCLEDDDSSLTNDDNGTHAHSFLTVTLYCIAEHNCLSLNKRVVRP